jgi:hypothetical protein
MNAATALTLLYVLSAIATFWFIRDRAKWRGVKFVASYVIWAALLWPVFFVYLMIMEFPKR